MTQGIYLITNNINNKHYVGQSVNIERRWYEHRITARSKANVRHLYPLYRAIDKYGIDNFSFEILEVVPKHSELNTLENKYIAKYNSIANGYNQIITSRNGLSKTELFKRRKREYNVTKDKLKSQLYKYNFEYVARIYGVSSKAIRNWCKDYGIPDKSEYYQTPQKRDEFSKKMKIVSKESSTTGRKIAMMDKKSGKIVKEFSSVGDAARFIGTSRANITRAVYGYENRKTAYGYRWAYIK